MDNYLGGGPWSKKEEREGACVGRGPAKPWKILKHERSDEHKGAVRPHVPGPSIGKAKLGGEDQEKKKKKKKKKLGKE